MSSTRFVSADALPGFLKKLSETYTLLAPQKQGKAVVFAPYDGSAVCMDKGSVSPKSAVLPACESLLSYQRQRQEDGSLKLVVEAAPKGTPTIIFACRPCDARGIATIDRPFLQGPYVDPYYKARREQLLVIARACNTPCSTCFCHWVGSGPHDTDGSDILLTDVSDTQDQPGFLLRGVTDKGKALLEQSALSDGTAMEASAEKAKAQAEADMDPAPDISSVRHKLAELFTDLDFWQQHTAPCLSCGACTYCCPACYCFNITDEGDGYQQGQDNPGQRLRTWDNCMASHFTREASGHNARTLKAQRMRNRVSHKFSNYPTVWKGMYSCTGCGRCIGQCPVNLDIRSLVLAAVTE